MNIQDCLKKGILKKTTPDFELCQKEFNEAMYDLQRAENTYMEEDYKWTIINYRA